MAELPFMSTEVILMECKSMVKVDACNDVALFKRVSHPCDENIFGNV
jgi:hypothetical protein